MRCFKMISGMLLVLALCTPAVYASSWMSDGNKRDVTTLVVCANTKSARLMADVIQAESKQPYLLLPAPRSTDTRVFFVPAKGPALELAPARVVHFVRFLNPRRIVVLNGEFMVWPRYEKYFDPNIPLMAVNCRNWERTAQELSYMLNITSLSRDYKRLRDKMLSDADMYRVISEPAKEAPVVEQPAAADAAAAAPAEAPKADAAAAAEPAKAAEPAPVGK